MNHAQDIPAYGLWSLVVVNSSVFIIFALSLFKPRTKRDWRTFGGFSPPSSGALRRDVRVPVDDLPGIGMDRA